MNILTVFKTEIVIGSIIVDAYTTNETSSTTGKFINYLSGSGLAASIELTDKTTRPQSLPEKLKSILGDDFATRPGRYKMESGGTSKINLWDTTSAAKYYLYHHGQGNELATRIAVALMSTTLDIIIDDRFGRVYKSGEAEARIKARLAGKVIRRGLTDAIKGWLEANETDRPLDFSMVYAQSTNQIYLALWGVTAADIRKHFNLKPGNIPPTRDYLSEQVLRVIERAEDRVIEAMDFDEAIPHENAVAIARIRPARISFKD